MKTVFFDVDTQLDFVYPAGALYVPGAGEHCREADQVDALCGGKVVSDHCTMDAHSEDDPEFKVWKPHCVVGTVGNRSAQGPWRPGRS